MALDNIDPLTGEVNSEFTFTLAASLLRPKCMGKVSLASRDPIAAPSIQLPYLCDPTGMLCFILCLELPICNTLLQTSSGQKML